MAYGHNHPLLTQNTRRSICNSRSGRTIKTRIIGVGRPYFDLFCITIPIVLRFETIRVSLGAMAWGFCWAVLCPGARGSGWPGWQARQSAQSLAGIKSYLQQIIVSNALGAVSRSPEQVFSTAPLFWDSIPRAFQHITRRMSIRVPRRPDALAAWAELEERARVGMQILQKQNCFKWIKHLTRMNSFCTKNLELPFPSQADSWKLRKSNSAAVYDGLVFLSWHMLGAFLLRYVAFILWF